jgi:hypothetical protein
MQHLPPAYHETSKCDSPNEQKIKLKQPSRPGFEFKPHKVNDSSQSNQGIDHLVSQLQSTERHLKHVGWCEFCAMVHERFGRDQHEALIRQLFHIRQSGSVTEYVDLFSSFVDHLAAYESQADPLYYIMHFVDGLRDDIKSMANGAKIQCIDHIHQAQWQIQDHAFYSDVKLLPLDHFDMILGYDWLEQFSPMKICNTHFLQE